MKGKVVTLGGQVYLSKHIIVLECANVVCSVFVGIYLCDVKMLAFSETK